MHRLFAVMLALALLLCACTPAESPPQPAPQSTPFPESPSEAGHESAPPEAPRKANPRLVQLSDYDAEYMELQIHYSGNVVKSYSLYLANIRFIPEFSDKNEGGVGFNGATGQIWLSVTKGTGTMTGAMDGPSVKLEYDTASGTILSKEFFPAPMYPDPALADKAGEVLDISDARLAEIALLFKEIILSGAKSEFQHEVMKENGVSSVVLEGYDATHLELFDYPKSSLDRTGSFFLYFADARFIPEFGDENHRNEGSVTVDKESGFYFIHTTNGAGMGVGCDNPPSLSFVYDPATGTLSDKKFTAEFADSSGTAPAVSDARLTEIALQFKEIIETQAARHFPQ